MRRGRAVLAKVTSTVNALRQGQGLFVLTTVRHKHRWAETKRKEVKQGQSQRSHWQISVDE